MPAFYQIEARRERKDVTKEPPSAAMWQAVIQGDRPASIALSLTAKPTPFPFNSFSTIVAALVAAGYEVRLAR